ncbi:MAG: EAL domain-containing protein [Sterolibacterium sp.]
MIGKNIWLTVVMLLALFIAFSIYVVTEKRIDHANEQRYSSDQLADQLRQSSDEMTRMARTYVVTGDPRYKAYYQEILDIRDGKKPRPAGYFYAYWDLVLENDQPPRIDNGAAIALLELIRQSGCTAEEYTKLAKAKENSDSLSRLEVDAMKLADSPGPETEAKRARALLMLHDDNYHRAKANIMRPINEYFLLMDQRTLDNVETAKQTAFVFRMIFIAVALGTLFMLWRVYASLRTTLGGSADEVHAQILRIGRGDFSTAIAIAPGMKNSVLANLLEMQNKLRALEISHQRAEESLRTRTARMNEAQHIAHIGSWYLDLLTGKLLWSDEIYRLFECDEVDPDQFGTTYEAFLAAIHPEDRTAVDRAYSDSLVSRTPYEITHRLLMRDGRIKWVVERGTSDFDAEGKPLRSMGTMQDITERKNAEEQLRIAAIVFESQEGMVVTDSRNMILRVNRAFTETTGYSAEELIGQTPSMLKSGRHDADFYRAMWESIQHTGGWQGEIWDRRKNGEVYPKWLTISAVKDDKGIVSHYVGTHFDITERKRAEEKINALAFFDQLTGLPNRTLLLDRLKQVMTASTRSGSYAALLFIDLDHFKTLNDTLGHEMGDLLLKEVSKSLRTCVREYDTVARLGGDEFVVVLAGLSPNENDAATHTEAAAAKILVALNQIYRLGEVAHQNSASIGATLFKGQTSTIDDLMKQADLAMYRSKSAGRNAVRFFDPAMESAVMERAALEKDLRLALSEKQFLLYYQAQVAGEQLTGAEVLVRWQHPRRGMVSPAEFIPLAEETGLISPLGHWVLETACAQLAAWATQPRMAHLTVAVNVSANQFNQPDFVEQVLTILNNTSANPYRLKLELTESLLVANVQDVIEKMFALKAKGVGFSLDDFGTGYSSLSYLKQLPLDQLKIDQSFVRDVLTDPNDAAIARTIVALAQSLGFGVIAEGVETSAQRDFLADSGCHAYQGYYFSRPLPLEGFEQFVQRV